MSVAKLYRRVSFASPAFFNRMPNARTLKVELMESLGIVIRDTEGQILDKVFGLVDVIESARPVKGRYPISITP